MSATTGRVLRRRASSPRFVAALRADASGMSEWLINRFEISRGSSGHNVRPMEGLRGFAVFLVFLVHYCTLIAPWIATQPTLTTIAQALHTIGNRGVDLFFVLSGYLIYGSLIARPQAFVGFMRRRIERIYPAFLVVFAIYVVLAYAMPSERKLPSDWWAATIYLVENLLLLPGLVPIEPLITVAWSLSYEMFYYLVIPLIIAVAALREKSASWRVAFFSTIAIGIAVYCALFAGPVRLIMFFSGILLHETMRGRRLPPPGSLVAGIALSGGLLLTLLPTLGSAGYVAKVAVLFAAFFVVCFSCFSVPSSPLARAFSVTPLRWLGNMSYSYYLLHGLVLKASFLIFGHLVPTSAASAGLFWLLLPAMFAITLLPTATLFLFVEYPLSLGPRRPLKAGNALAVASTATSSS